MTKIPDNLKAILNQTNWQMLAKQKLDVISAANHGYDDPDGLLNRIDMIQDVAEKAGYPVVWLTDDSD